MTKQWNSARILITEVDCAVSQQIFDFVFSVDGDMWDFWIDSGRISCEKWESFIEKKDFLFICLLVFQDDNVLKPALHWSRWCRLNFPLLHTANSVYFIMF